MKKGMVTITLQFLKLLLLKPYFILPQQFVILHHGTILEEHGTV